MNSLLVLTDYQMLAGVILIWAVGLLFFVFYNAWTQELDSVNIQELSFKDKKMQKQVRLAFITMLPLTFFGYIVLLYSTNWVTHRNIINMGMISAVFTVLHFIGISAAILFIGWLGNRLYEFFCSLVAWIFHDGTPLGKQTIEKERI